MIAKCLVVLVAASQIGAFKFAEESKSEKSEQTSSVKYTYHPVPAGETYARLVPAAAIAKSTPIQTRNIVAKGKYPVTLQSSGPAPDRKIPVVTSHIRAPVQEKPTVRLQAKIPAPRTIAHTCTCYKTILKPKVQQHLITVPSIQRYIETTHRPVVENIHYEAVPVGYVDSGSGDSSEGKPKGEAFELSFSAADSQEKKNPQVFELPPGFEMPKAEKPQLIEIPRVQFVEARKPEKIEMPRVQFVEACKPEKLEMPRVQFVEACRPEFEVPRVQFVEARKAEEYEVPRAQFFENKKTQVVEIPSSHFVDAKPEAVEMPKVEFVQAQKLQTVEIPRFQVAESPKLQTVEIPRQSEAITLGCAPFAYQFKN